MGDVFVHDRSTGVTELVSIAEGVLLNKKGSAAPSISGDGRYVAFNAYVTEEGLEFPGIYTWISAIIVRDRSTMRTSRITPIYEWKINEPYWENSFTAKISANGRYVTFMSALHRIVPNDTNDAEDIFVYDMQTEEISRVSVASGGAQADNDSATPSISSDGQLVAFMSGAGNLVMGDTNGIPDVFVHDRGTGETRRVSVAADGTQTSGQSADSRLPSISANGRYVAFQTNASNLVPVDTNNALDVFLTDLQSGDIRIVSMSYDGSQGDYQSMAPSVSADGSFIAFGSSAHNLVADDTNNKRDIFVSGGVNKLTTFLPLIIR
jgi:Tol biopolymer transport system component